MAKRKRTRVDRNSPEAAAEENREAYEEVGGKEDDHLHEDQGELHQEPGPNPPAVPQDGS